MNSEYLMSVAALGLIFALSYLSGYIFFNSSLIAVISVVAIMICFNLHQETIKEENILK